MMMDNKVYLQIMAEKIMEVTAKECNMIVMTQIIIGT